jgi:hypothetical protein
MYRKIFKLLALHNRQCVQVIDYCRIIPLLADWSDEVVWHSGCSQDVLFLQMESHGKWLTLNEVKLPKIQLELWVVMK